MKNENTPTSAQQDQLYKLAASKKIMKLLAPAKGLSVSKLILLKKEQLNAIGKASRELYDVLNNAGMVSRSQGSDKKW